MHIEYTTKIKDKNFTFWEFASLPSLELSLPLSPLQKAAAILLLMHIENYTQYIQMLFKYFDNKQTFER
jgi:hypothetical protein